MSKYTTEIRFICESKASPQILERGNIDEIIESARPQIFNFDYPIFDPAYKATLEGKILKHYYTREIGAETFGLWRLQLNAKLCDIMPLYNQKYLLALQASKKWENEDFLKTHDLYTKSDTLGTSKNETSDSSKTIGQSQTSAKNASSANDKTTYTHSNTHTDAFSNTPQGYLSGVESNRYLTDYRKTTDQESNTNQSNSTSNASDESNQSASSDTSSKGLQNGQTTQDYLSRTWGYSGQNPLEVFEKIYNSLVNIDLEIINELKPLFFGLW